MKKKALATCLAGTMLLGSVTTSALAVDVNQLVDVEKSDWFYPYVEYVAGKDYMKGISSTQFAPMMEMNRAMFVTVLYRLDNPKGVSSQSNFVDVPSDTWYTQAVNWAAANKIVNGIGNDKFAPDDSITREQICTIVARYVEYRAKKDNKTYKTTEKEKTFPDADQIGEYAKEAVKKCQMWGLIEGNEKGYMNPLNTATRAEVAAIVQRLDDLLASGQSSGGSGGGGGGDQTTTETKTEEYWVKVALTVPTEGNTGLTSAEGTSEFVSSKVKVTTKTTKDKNGNITKTEVTAENDKDFEAVLKELVSGDNVTNLQTRMELLMDKQLLDETQTFDATIDGQKGKVTIEVVKDESGKITDRVISATVSMNVASLNKDGGELQTLAVSQDKLVELAEKLQNGGNITLSQAEVEALDELVEKADEVANQWDTDKIEQKLEEYKKENPEIAKVVDGMSAQDIKSAVKDYHEQLVDIQEEVAAATPGEDGSIALGEREPVMTEVPLDLGVYYQQALDKYNPEDEEGKPSSTYKSAKLKAEEKLWGVDKNGEALQHFTTEQETAFKALYDLSNPANFVTNMKDKTLKLVSNSDYANLMVQYVKATADFWTALGEDTAFYTRKLNHWNTDDQKDVAAYYGVTYTFDQELLTEMLDGENIYLDLKTILDEAAKEETDVSDTTANSTELLKVTADLNNTTYTNIAEKLVQVLTDRGYDSVAGAVPTVLEDAPLMIQDMVGEYTLTVSIEKGNA